MKYLLAFVAGIVTCDFLRFVLIKDKPPKPKLLFTVFINQSQFQTNKMEIQKSKFPVTGHIAPTDDQGKAHDVQSITFTSTNAAAVTVTQDATDPKKFQLNFVGAGTAQIMATADADLGQGVVTLTDSLEVTAVEDEATKLNIALDL